MARKKRQPGDESAPKKSSGKKDLPDRRSVEGVLRQLLGGLSGQSADDSAAGRAQAVLEQAYEEPDPDHRVALARQALTLDADCADAYVLLAEHAPTRRQALELYQEGVRAAERTLGPEPFARDVGHFWGLLETRPYMRARAGLADRLWTAGQRDEAVAHVRDLLRLNPGDNQGLRYTLAAWLLFLDRDDELSTLLEQYAEDGSAAWAYTRALLAFRREGSTIASRRLLKAARKVNKHVPAYLLGEKFPPEEPPASYSPGAESEAVMYVDAFLSGWKSTAGAIAWVRENSKTRKKQPEAPPKGPTAAGKKILTGRLPQQDDVWQADFRQMPTWVRIAGEPVRPWTILVANRTYDLVLGHAMIEATPTAEHLWDAVVQAMQHPLAGLSQRPARLEVRADERWETLRPHLEQIGVSLDVLPQLSLLGEMFDAMFEQVCGPTVPGILTAPGITPEQVGSFYDAAAAFFRQAPWKAVGYEAAIRVQCDRFRGGPWFAVLMGQSGLTTGLALYEDWQTLRALWSGGADEEHARQTVATTVTFVEEWDLPTSDLEAARQHGWPVARPDAYPEVFHKDRGLSMRPPLAWELQLLEACLRAVPDFVKRHPQDDGGTETFKVPTGGGALALTLSWMDESA